MKRSLLLLCMFALVPFGFARGDDNLVQLAASNGQFKTLVNLLVLTGLDQALQSHDELTVFAPTDEAFAKLPSETLQSLLKPSGRETLATILKAHVIPGSVKLGDFKRSSPGKLIKTLEGTAFNLTGDGLMPQFGTAQVINANIQASNGLIHVIDSVLMPKPKQDNIVETAKSTGQFSTLLAALNAADLTDVFRGDAPFTILAPTDEAFAKIPEATLASLLLPENKETLVSILKFHVVAGSVTANSAITASKATTLQGAQVRFQLEDGRLKVENAIVLKNDVTASNGIIHVIDNVLMPPTTVKHSVQKPIGITKCKAASH
jgi:transforming growth factor-beta-induced protein